jgi:hypothetical protein
MKQRSILAGANPTVIIKVGGSVTVKTHESDMVVVETSDKWGLKVEKRSEEELARARAAVGDYVLFDIKIKKPNFQKEEEPDDAIMVQLGGSGEVLVPIHSRLKVYAGKNIDVQGIQNQVDAYAGQNLTLQHVLCLGNASAGSSMNIDCQTMIGKEVTFGTGRDFRFHIADLTSAHLRVKDIGGYWEARVGEGDERSIYLKCGGDVTFVTDQKVEPLPPNYILGKIEKPVTS